MHSLTKRQAMNYMQSKRQRDQRNTTRNRLSKRSNDMKHRTLIASLAIVASMAAWAQPKPVSITTYQGPAVDDNLAKEIVREGSHRLVIDNGGNPVSCGLDLAAVTPLRVLTVEPSAVVFPDDYRKICDVAADIHVVKSIESCGQFGD